MEQIFLSLGSNLGERQENLREAIRRIRRFAQVENTSMAYETEPEEYTAQPWFLNAVVAIRFPETSAGLGPHQLLSLLLAVERAMGRQRLVPKGPRVIDLDILLYGSRTINEADLTIPHPALHLRRFVLAPLAEIAPRILHPVLHKSALELLLALPQNGPLVRKLAPLE